MNIVIVSLFIAMVLNFAEKIIIQLIAISFHQRTYVRSSYTIYSLYNITY